MRNSSVEYGNPIEILSAAARHCFQAQDYNSCRSLHAMAIRISNTEQMQYKPWEIQRHIVASDRQRKIKNRKTT